jgi:hypothetical protein
VIQKLYPINTIRQYLKLENFPELRHDKHFGLVLNLAKERNSLHGVKSAKNVD